MITPSLADLIQAAISARLAEVYTQLPGRVESYDAATQTASIKIMIRTPLENLDGDITLEDLPVIQSVPVSFARGGQFFESFPLTPGDEGMCQFSMRDINEWRRTGQLVDPGDIRTHRIAGATFFPGVSSSARRLDSAHEQNYVMGKDGSTTIHFKPDGTLAIGAENPGDFIAKANEVLARLNTIVDKFNSHTHAAGLLLDSTSAPVTGFTGAPPVLQTIGTMASVASAVKVI